MWVQLIGTACAITFFFICPLMLAREDTDELFWLCVMVGSFFLGGLLPMSL